MHSDIVISQSDGRPMYLQIMEQVRQRVAVGEWAPGNEIPSIRQLAMDLRVSVITIKRAYLELEREGVILTQQGKGSIIAPNPGLSPQLYHEELSEHLDEVVRLGDLLGLSSEEIARRTRDASNRLNESRLTKEIV
ncbi:MAG: GntR family transcriptional regulator [Terracidiphilus sp.]|jgi:GntR family transcriptional regulator